MFYKPASSRLRRFTPGRTFSRSLAIQRAGFIRNTQLVKFTLFRTFTYKNSQAHELPYIKFWANSPYNCQAGAQPNNSWILQDNMSTSDSATNLTEWVSDAAPAVGNTAKYREGRTLGSTIFVSARPKHAASEGPDTNCDYAALVVHLGTGPNEWGNSLTISPGNARDNFERLPYTRKGQTAVNPNGTPRGCAISMSYSFKKMNAGRVNTNNTFFANAHPGEADYWYIGLFPFDYVAYVDPASPEKIADHLITIRLEYLCLMSEPNTHLYQVNRD